MLSVWTPYMRNWRYTYYCFRNHWKIAPFNICSSTVMDFTLPIRQHHLFVVTQAEFLYVFKPLRPNFFKKNERGNRAWFCPLWNFKWNKYFGNCVMLFHSFEKKMILFVWHFCKPQTYMCLFPLKAYMQDVHCSKRNLDEVTFLKHLPY